VHVTSKRGSIVLPVQASTELGLSQAFIAMHWGSEYLGGVSSTGEPLAGVNAITTSAYCPTSKQPELKHAAVKILKAELPWTLLAWPGCRRSDALDVREQLKALMARCSPSPPACPSPTTRRWSRRQRASAAACCSAPPPTRRRRRNWCSAGSAAGPGRRRDAALRRPPQGPAPQRSACGATAPTCARGLLLAGDTSAEAWLKSLLLQELPAQAYGRLLLAPGAKAPVAVQQKGKQVCSCFGVEAPAIEATWRSAAARRRSGWPRCRRALRCGTNCGSCVPELKRMVRAVVPLPQAA
jgi:assimilatory nitrate reductase catalytic subunit